ncbi:hypothetical protein DRF67_18120 [Chryseobacterium pennipullorum]|uniref:Uncharacterized protein n=1 Tax=Chryseobacterium pennipullorum TaxID=2258963 RepID=A0A3D9AT14_9FLAO|nr:hypothetical protein DRF67_18120 [Chryseobacterium pennipullorum]
MKKVVWRGLVYKSWENCTIELKNDVYYVKSVIIGNYLNRIYHVDYVLKIEKLYMQEFEIKNRN